MIRRNLLSRTWVAALALAGILWVAAPSSAQAGSAEEINAQAVAALERLYAQVPVARTVAEDAVAVLVFPRITKGGFVVGAQAGEGVLLRDGQPQHYYGVLAASVGLQIGVQTFGYALMFMTEDEVSYLDRSDGWEIGVGPSVVVVDQGMAQTLSSSTLRDDVYAFVFGQQGLMAGAGLQGSKITRIEPEP